MKLLMWISKREYRLQFRGIAYIMLPIGRTICYLVPLMRIIINQHQGHPAKGDQPAIRGRC
jgi:hypothetical protein